MAESQKVICVGLNYHDHAAEQGAELPEEPLLFGKFASAIVGPDDAIVLPPESAHVDAEAELAVVIARKGGGSQRQTRSTSSPATPSRTTSPRGTCRRATASGCGPRASTRSARS